MRKDEASLFRLDVHLARSLPTQKGRRMLGAPWEADMKFGYFTLSDNHYDNNSRSANDFVADIVDEAVYAEEVGLHSAWIGEHHFSTLGVLSCPDLVLAKSRREQGESGSPLP